MTIQEAKARLVDRARAYVAKMPPAIQGHRGSDATFAVAKKLTHDFDLPAADAWQVLSEYNSRCSPPWSDAELRHKLEDASKCNRSEIPRGELASSISKQATRPTPQNLEGKDSDEKRSKRAAWPQMEVLTREEQESIATLRRLPVEGPQCAAIDAALRVATIDGERCWIIRSTCGKNAQARRLDGQPLGEKLKAKTLPGSIATLPVGNYHDTRWPAVALVEGGPDVLAAYAGIHKLGLLDVVSVCGILGASMQPPFGVWASMKNRKVRIFQHNDEAGRKAAKLWAWFIRGAGGIVDAWTPAQEGADLNDIFDQPQAEFSAALQEAFNFVKGAN
jgi:hypothetical protein